MTKQQTRKELESVVSVLQQAEGDGRTEYYYKTSGICLKLQRVALEGQFPNNEVRKGLWSIYQSSRAMEQSALLAALSFALTAI